MHKQRIILALAAFSGLISPFLTWVKIEDDTSLTILTLLKTPGVFGFIPIILLILFFISLFISLYGNRGFQIQRYQFLKIIPALICVLIDMLYYFIIRLDHDKPGIGLYINMVSGILFIATLLMGKSAEGSRIRPKRKLRIIGRWISITLLIAILINLIIIYFNRGSQHLKIDSVVIPPYYQLVKDWPDLPANYVMGNPTGIGIDSNQDIFVFHRVKRAWSLIRPMPQSFIAENTILQLDNKSGKMINSWGADLFIMPHGLTVDKNNNVWVTDVALHQVFKFSHDGKLLMKLGEAKVAGNDSAHFNQPTDVAIAPDGSFYVSDGYGNNRVIKFSSSGNYLFEWGTKGDQAGQFNVPHAIDLDSVGNVYVADRENSRVQIFDSNGKYLSGWKNTDQNGKIYSVAVNKQRDEFILIDYATDFFIVPSRSDIIFGLKHKYPQRFAQSGLYDGTVSRYHDVAIDNEGNIYTGDILNNRVLKFRPRN